MCLSSKVSWQGLYTSSYSLLLPLVLLRSHEQTMASSFESSTFLPLVLAFSPESPPASCGSWVHGLSFPLGSQGWGQVNTWNGSYLAERLGRVGESTENKTAKTLALLPYFIHVVLISLKVTEKGLQWPNLTLASENPLIDSTIFSSPESQFLSSWVREGRQILFLKTQALPWIFYPLNFQGNRVMIEFLISILQMRL